ncbi:hypothetical protein NBRC116188_26950 [Oceaniserpentilla sp. 4NH20-0058]|uniref:hypothetical protein n=1 Tax=Oceaniserpentilla sp. 4NH20-0058 TaxID=3127660 RepID=UPI0031033331
MRTIKQFTDDENRVFASISIDTELSLLMCIWFGEISHVGQVTQVHGFCSEQVKELDIKNWLSDVTALEGSYLNFSGESQKSIFEGLSQTQLQRFAIISQRPANPARSAMISTLKEMHIEGRTFNQIPEALNWLTENKSLSYNWGIRNVS